MKKLYQTICRRFLLLPVLALLSCLGTKAQQTIVYADPALGSFDITNLSDVSVNANALQQNSIYKLKLDVLNFDLTNAIPNGTAYVDIGLGTKLVLAPGFNLATAALNNYFTFTYFLVGSQYHIKCELHTPLPADFSGQFSFNIKANTQGSSTVAATFYVANNNPNYILSDINSGNNNASISYSIGASGPLPVTITSFTARNKDCRINLNWTVAQEINLAKYEVEVSKDGINFVKAAELPSLGSSNYSTSFALTEQLKAATLLVRLKSIDKDGSFKYSPVVTVSGLCSARSQQDIYCYPNPVISADNITIASRGELFNGTYQLSLMDVSGRNYLSKQVVVNSAASFKFEFGKKLAAGKYFIILRRADGSTDAVLQFEKL